MRTRLVAALLALLFPVFVYLVVLAVVFFAQTSLIFPVGQVAPEPPLPRGSERLTITAASGDRLAGVHIPSARAGAAHLLILGFGGNAANAGGTALLLHDLYPDADIVTFHYRGYPPSGGEPSAAALQADALVIHDFLRARLHPARLVVAGFSVGSGVAAYLAAHRPVGGLVLVTPFDSLAGVAAGHYPWLPVRLLMRHNMEPAADLHGVAVPVAIIAGGRDSLIPAARTDALRHALPHLVLDRTIPGAGHNDIYDNPAFPETMRQALAAVVR